MTTITADDVRTLAQARGEDQVLALAGDRVTVVSAADAAGTGTDKIVYTQAELLRQFGEEVTDAEAELLAAALTARITEASPS